jgi:formyl-CoA transferase/CoA:oxalate CoA-transferase
MTTKQKRRILEGLCVLDFTHVVAGPYATRVLADLGARVIKIDPPFQETASTPIQSTGGPTRNLGKESIALDLKRKPGLEVALQLARMADIVVENFRPGVMPQLGLGFKDLSSINPRLICASISGFGQSGPLSSRRAYGAVAHAETGWLWVQQQAAESAAPFAPGVTVADIVTAMNCVSAILAALYDRAMTGKGQHIDVTLMESQIAMLSEIAGPALDGSPVSDWQPFRHPIHETRDGHVTINLGTERNWIRIAEAFDHQEEPVPENTGAANNMIAGWVSNFSTDEVANRMDRTGAPYGIVRTLHDAVKDPYFSDRGMVVQVDGKQTKPVTVIGSPLHFSEAASGPQSPSPLAGEHSKAILNELGYTNTQILHLLEARTVVQQDR